MANRRPRLDDGIKFDLQRVAEERRYNHKEPCMFPVRMLVNVKADDYAPEVISLGLFKRSPWNAPKTRADQSRLEMACALLRIIPGMKEGNNDDWDQLCTMVVPDPQQMRDLYYGIGDLADPLSDKEIQSALTLDAIFVAFFIMGRSLDLPPEFNHPLALVRNIHEENVMHDILSVENQIPLILIENILLILRLDHDQILRYMSQTMAYYLESLVPGRQREGFRLRQGVSYDFSQYNHLLDFAYRWQLHPVAPLQHTRENDNGLAFCYEIGNDCYSCCITIKDGLCGSEVLSTPENRFEAEKPASSFYQGASEFQGARRSISLPSVARLRGAGIEFHGFKGTFNDVSFHGGRLGLFNAVLYLPEMIIDVETLSMWRNLAAFEKLQRMGDLNKSCEFICFLAFMNNMIDDENDVLLLRKGNHPVILENWLGNDKDVATAINTMVTNYTPHEEGPKWGKLKDDILKYYNKVPRRLSVEFIRLNFGKPWFLFPFLAGIVLLGSTFLQTIYTLRGYYK